MMLLSLSYLTLFLSGLVSVRGEAFPYERLDVNNKALLIVDHQIGLMNYVHDIENTRFYRSVIAHATLAELFDIPVVMTTSGETGPNGPLLQEIRDMYPDAPFILRKGEIDAWDHPDVRKVVEATHRKQMIIAGIATDVCTAFLALSLRAEGYSVWANVEASGTNTPLIQEVTNAQMRDAGVHLVGINALLGYLVKDFSNPVPGGVRIYDWIEQYLPEGLMTARLFTTASGNNTF
ncbi:hypothetical protein TRIATDRAFT_263288 [Trichoderma atroviride IMI 206040]|uniref:Isochorismatase-like domain-containing protein n=1 Tax=Hypocrea atroviridis (strain ATCC 20476 / IMI 206040) TaxID=452589 RepID=G9NQJ7_HYPAI|nr:uncharacterized protein TRIATDRAFT_263288 [Trichoderma atroviride IMI 206040]EHK46820.1 hypothetical protein TRIATDRAFT_263288 [Trichoderma atroviride IMI 206040]